MKQSMLFECQTDKGSVLWIGLMVGYHSKTSRYSHNLTNNNAIHGFKQWPSNLFIKSNTRIGLAYIRSTNQLKLRRGGILIS